MILQLRARVFTARVHAVLLGYAAQSSLTRQMTTRRRRVDDVCLWSQRWTSNERMHQTSSVVVPICTTGNSCLPGAAIAVAADGWVCALDFHSRFLLSDRKGVELPENEW